LNVIESTLPEPARRVAGLVTASPSVLGVCGALSRRWFEKLSTDRFRVLPHIPRRAILLGLASAPPAIAAGVAVLLPSDAQRLS
jgi:hypothetical protein